MTLSLAALAAGRAAITPVDRSDAAPHRATGPQAAYRVELNTASTAELRLLPGLGRVLAERVVEHREAVGGFDRVSDLDAVSGIGPVTLERIRPWVVVAPAR